MAFTSIRKLWDTLFNSDSPGTKQLLYTNSGRDGYVIYKDEQGEISMYFEFGGGDCVAVIQFPTIAEWTSTFKRPQEERDAVLHFTAKQAIKDKAPGCDYRISGNFIELFKK